MIGSTSATASGWRWPRHAGEDADRGERGVDGEHPDEEAQLQLRRRRRERARSRSPVKPASKSACTARARARTGQSSRPTCAGPSTAMTSAGPTAYQASGQRRRRARDGWTSRRR